MNTKNAPLTRRSFFGGAAVFATSLSFSPFAFATEADDIAAKAQVARNSLGQMQIQLGQASDAYFEALEARDIAQEKVDQAAAHIKENTERIANLQSSLSLRVHDMYTNGQANIFDVFLGSTSFEAFVRNWDALSAMNETDADLVRDTKILRQQNESQKKVLQLQTEEATRQMEQAEQARKQAEVLVNEYQAKVNSLDAQVAKALEQEQQQAYEAAQEVVEEMDEGLAARQAQELKNGQSSTSGDSARGQSNQTNQNSQAPAVTTKQDNTATSQSTQKAGTSTNQSKSNSTTTLPSSSTSTSNSGSSNQNSAKNTSTNTNANSSQSVPKANTTTQDKQTSPQVLSAGTNAYGAAILAAAQYQVGVWYVWGGTKAFDGAGDRANIGRYGLDCSGLTSHCWLAATGKYIGRTSGAQFASATWRGLPSQAQVGDVLYCDGHVGICAAPGATAYIHAPTTGQKVTYQLSKYWNPWTHALRW